MIGFLKEGLALEPCPAGQSLVTLSQDDRLHQPIRAAALHSPATAVEGSRAQGEARNVGQQEPRSRICLLRHRACGGGGPEKTCSLASV